MNYIYVSMLMYSHGMYNMYKCCFGLVSSMFVLQSFKHIYKAKLKHSQLPNQLNLAIHWNFGKPLMCMYLTSTAFRIFC